MNPTLNLRSNPVVRGFIPDGQRSGPKTYARGQSDGFGYQVSGLLRSPSGINPLTTRIPLTIESRDDAGPVGAAAGCDLLLWLFSMSLKIKIQRSQPEAAPTLLNPTLNLRSKPVVRGFIPDGQRSGPKTYARGQSDGFGYQVSGLLRSPSGINPLTTRIPLTVESRDDAGPVGAAEGCDLLIFKSKRSQPAAPPTRECNAMGGGCR